MALAMMRAVYGLLSLLCDSESSCSWCPVIPRSLLSLLAENTSFLSPSQQFDLHLLTDVLRTERGRFEPLLRQFNLYNPFDLLELEEGSVSLYSELFRTLQGHICLGAVLLRHPDRAAMVEGVYKALILATGIRKYPEISDVVESICDRVVRAQFARPLTTPWAEICQDRTLDALVAGLSARELHYVLGEKDPERFVLISNRVHPYGQASSELLQRARRVPVEVGPNDKAMCLGLRLAYYCEALVQKNPQISNISRKISRLRVMQEYISYVLPEMRQAALGFDLDFRPVESEIFDEVRNLDNGYLAIFQHAASSGQVKDFWPFVERLTSAESRGDVVAEIAVVLNGKVDEFIRNVQTICQDYIENPRCHRLRSEFRSVGAADINLLAAGQINTFSLAYKFFGLLSRGVPSDSLDQFMITNAVQAVQSGDECCVCYRSFIDWDGVFPVAVCPPEGAVAGHVMCETCLRRMVTTSTGKLDCPICRKHVKFTL